MKKINIIITFIILGLFVVSCETYDDFNADRKTVVGFTKPIDNNINNIPEGGERTRTFDNVLFASDLADVDRQFKVIVIPTILEIADPPLVATNPENYTFEAMVTIPANSQRGGITITGIDNSIEDERGEYFTVAIEGGGNVVSGGRFTVRLRQ
ncbi:hypothetical protein [Aequorivita antarctica]|uniref:DUF4843 domain-containing protein n=1 Tax=Aequorivita antarctica TaxID=153266 RepID=A0A5C6YZ87_9FLAO|nr:hypothetical protein [Aequorivita antarctica]TXD72981.1 hypothetical protein ESU54_10025 [Aequorivita antarctica]SRX74612.1 hypothetical protein AEQU3_01591 [Aequorivita antarctica]